MSTILVTGFGAFPGAPKNPTALLVDALVRRRRPAAGNIRLVTHVFETRYDAVDRDLPRLLAREKPDAVILFGVATRAKRVRLELVARNRASVLVPDAGGARPDKHVITSGAPFFRSGRFPRAALTAALCAGGVGPLQSRNAGSYLCNYAYWHALEAAERPGGPRLVVFVHVPPLRPVSRPASRVAAPRAAPRPPRTTYERMADTLIIAVEAAVRASARRCSPAMPALVAGIHG